MKPTEKQLAALNRLWEIANGGSGQCKIVAKFLLGLYNGETYPFNLNDFRGLDTNIFIDCLNVLQMDSQPYKEVHELLNKTSGQFPNLAKEWGIEGKEEV